MVSPWTPVEFVLGADVHPAISELKTPIVKAMPPMYTIFLVIIIHFLGRHRSVVCGWKKGKGRAWRALVPHHATTVMIARPRFLELGETAYFWWDSIL